MRIFIVNWADPAMGALRMRRGWFGEVVLSEQDIFRTELRGMTQALQQRIGALCSPECRADLGDHRCKVPVDPSEIARLRVYTAGGVVRVRTTGTPVSFALPRAWRAVGFGALFEEAETVTHSHAGRDLKPYAPVRVTATRSGTPEDITLSWIRRTRIGGDLRDGTGTVPLAEAHEAYEVDILDGPGGTVLRTLTAPGPAVTYASADIAADFGSTPTELSVVIYQMSDVAGRGFPRAVTLEIA